MGPSGLSKGYDKKCLYKIQAQRVRNGFMVNFSIEGRFLVVYNPSVKQDKC